MTSLFFSALSYYLASWYCGRLLRDYIGLEKGIAKSIYCFFAGLLVSVIVGATFDAISPSEAINPISLISGTVAPGGPGGPGGPTASDINEVTRALKDLSH